METESKKQTEKIETIKQTGMEYSYLFILVLILTFIVIPLYGAFCYEPSQKGIPQTAQVTISNIQDSIRVLNNDVISLQDSINNILAKNLDLELKMKVNNLENEVIKYRDDFRHSVNEYHDKMDHKINLIAIIMGVLGVVFGILAPWFFNSHSADNAEKARNEAETAKKKVEDAQKALEEATKSAEQAQKDAKTAKQSAEKTAEVKKDVKRLAQNIINTNEDVKNAIKKAQAVQYFIQALQESDNNRAIKLYTDCINMNEGFAEAYNNRGFLMHKQGASYPSDEILKDYTKAINLFKEEGRGIYAEAYNNRGILYFENNNLKEAENDFNAAISKDYAESFLNLGLLKYRNGNIYEAPNEIDKAIDKKHDFAEAYYIKGLMNYYGFFDFEKDDAIKDIIKAKEHKPNVVEDYSNRKLLPKKLKYLDNSINGIEYSKDMTKLLRVPKERDTAFFIPHFVTKIENNSFEECSKLTTIKIPDSVTMIGEDAFKGCISLESIKIPATVTEIGQRAFIGCIGLKTIVVDKKNTNYCSADDILYSIDKSKLIALSASKESITIPDSVTEIEVGAFWHPSKLKEIHLEHKTFMDFSRAFMFLKKNNVTLYVPKGFGNVYKNNQLYSDIKDIIQEEK